MDISEIGATMTQRRNAGLVSPKPLKTAVFYILLALAERDNYGYAVMQAVRRTSDGHVALSPGSFYRHLAKLMSDGLVMESAPRRAGDDPRRGSYYRLTARGHSVLADERRRLAALVAAIDGLVPRRGQA
jgi:DNA-binding PadR family transcriptional regulator